MMNAEPMQKKLSAFMPETLVLPELMDVVVSGLADDSRSVVPGDMFLAYPGENADGRKFIDAACEKGCAVVLAEEGDQYTLAAFTDNGIPVLVIPQLKQQVAEIAAAFYEHPSKSLQVIGITGTNGKTTCSQMLVEALYDLGETVAVMGTLGNGVWGELLLEEVSNTTVGAVEMHKQLRSFVNQQARYVVMEVSSHGLAQGRVDSVNFDMAILTNLSRDHLDYHGTMEAYQAEKRKLFLMPSLSSVILNGDDEFGQSLLSELSADENDAEALDAVLSYAVDSPADFSVDMVSCHEDGLLMSVQHKDVEYELSSYLLGEFNVENILACFAALSQLSYPPSSVVGALRRIMPIVGRMERLPSDCGPAVVVDFAHTPNALGSALAACRTHFTGNVICVFGCGGERDKGKRAEMAAIAEQNADQVIVTADNSRGEKTDAIIADIVAGFTHTFSVMVESDRGAAIEKAVLFAAPDDVVLLAGKGHEQYQDVAGVKTFFSDHQCAENVLARYEGGQH